MRERWYEALTSLHRDTVSANVHFKEPRRNVDDREREDLTDEKEFGGFASSVRELLDWTFSSHSGEDEQFYRFFVLYIAIY